MADLACEMWSSVSARVGGGVWVVTDGAGELLFMENLLLNVGTLKLGVAGEAARMVVGVVTADLGRDIGVGVG